MKTKSNYEDAGWDMDNIWYMEMTVVSTYENNVECVEVIPTGTGEDELWVSMYRLINSEMRRYLEQLQPRVYGDDIEDAWFVDSGYEYDSTATDTFSGLDHLEGEDIVVLGDGTEYSATVSSGAITISDSVSHAIIGLAFTYKLKPMRLDLTYDDYTSKGSLKSCKEVVMDFLESMDVQYGADEDSTYDVEGMSTVYTGEQVCILDSGFNVEDPLLITGSGPFPCIVRALVPRVEIYGR